MDKFNFLNIADEIKYLEKVIKEKDFKDSYSNQIENNSNLFQNEAIRKRKEIFSSTNSRKIDFSEYDDLTIKEIKDRFKDKNTSYEEKMFYKSLLSYRTERK